MKVLVNNVVTNKDYKAQFSTQNEAEAYVQSQLDKGMKCPWGKPDYFDVKDENNHEDLRAVFVEEVVYDQSYNEYELDENNEPVVTNHVEKLVTKYKFLIPCEYSITYEDDSAELALQEVLNNRIKEYPSINEIIHTIMDKGLDSPEMSELQTLRQLVKNKYPKP